MKKDSKGEAKQKRLEKKNLIIDLENVALAYEKAHLQSKEMDDIKSKSRKRATEIIDELGVEVIEVAKQSNSVMKVQKVHKKTVVYDDKKIMKLLQSKGRDILKRATKVIVDRGALDALYNEGIISYDDIQPCISNIADSTETRIQRVKARSLKDEL